MQIQLIRNATLRMTYGDRTFITDLYLAPKYSQEPLIGKARNPMMDLPFPPKDVLADIEMALVSHLHPDHFDNLAQQLLPKNTVSGFIFRADNEPTIYWAGDTIWCETVKQVVLDAEPDIIITHSSGASFEPGKPIIMDARQTIEVCRTAPQSIVIAIHMETFDFDTVSRKDLRTMAEVEGTEARQLLIPADGETLVLS